MDGKTDKEIYIECLKMAYKEKYLKKGWEFRMYTNAIYQAVQWGRKVDRENMEYKKKQSLLNRC